jgi:hypothetical protein
MASPRKLHIPRIAMGDMEGFGIVFNNIPKDKA